jgi:GT2 family glycosyltransferase
MRPLSVDVVIVNWNAGPLLQQSVAPLREGTAAAICVNVFVVDNGSHDGSEAAIAAQYPDVRIIHNGVNRGFASACNQGAACGAAEYILFLNPDAQLQVEDLAGMLKLMSGRGHENTAVLGPQIRNALGTVERTCARSPNCRHFVLRALGLHRLLPPIVADFTMREFDHASSRSVDQVIGACFLTRRKDFQALGGFDERFFVYFEEVDYCRRVAASGRKVYFWSGARVAHVGGGTTRRVKSFRLYLSLRSRITYAHKWFGWWNAAVVDVTTLFAEPAVRVAHAALTGDTASVRDVVSSAGSLWKWRLRRGLTCRLRQSSKGGKIPDLGPI